MPVQRPRFPRGSNTRQPGPGQQSLFPDVVRDVPPIRRVKSIGQTQQDRSKGLQGRQRAVPPPIRAIRARGSEFGWAQAEQVLEDADEFEFPQIDPTNTTNPSRPRTLQAGYYRVRGESTGVLRVRFRDGTPWEYLGVPPGVWRNFKRVKSPGRFIARVLNNYDYQRGDF